MVLCIGAFNFVLLYFVLFSNKFSQNLICYWPVLPLYID